MQQLRQRVACSQVRRTAVHRGAEIPHAAGPSCAITLPHPRVSVLFPVVGAEILKDSHLDNRHPLLDGLLSLTLTVFGFLSLYLFVNIEASQICVILTCIVFI